MRYFGSSVTGRPLVLGSGHSFSFESVEQLGGTWIGVLALGEPDASILADANVGVVWEYTEEQYQALKKKLQTPNSNGFVPSQQPRPPATSLVASAGPAGLPTTPAPTGSSQPPVKGIELQFTSEQPPPEPLLEVAIKKPRKAA